MPLWSARRSVNVRSGTTRRFFLMNGQGDRNEQFNTICHSSPLSSTMACTALFACTKNANIRVAFPRPSFAIQCLCPCVRRLRHLGRGTEDFPAAFGEAQACGKPAIIRLAIDPQAITPGSFDGLGSTSL